MELFEKRTLLHKWAFCAWQSVGENQSQYPKQDNQYEGGLDAPKKVSADKTTNGWADHQPQSHHTSAQAQEFYMLALRSDFGQIGHRGNPQTEVC
jgi:hypothetical protein